MELQLSVNGESASVDSADWPKVSQYRWYASARDRYVRGYVNGQTVYLHRFLMGLAKGDCREVDHIDHNPRNNQRTNLRIVTHAENQLNRKPFKPRSNVGIAGVFREGATGKLIAFATIDGRYTNLGRFATVEEAVAARQAFFAARLQEHVAPPVYEVA